MVCLRLHCRFGAGLPVDLVVSLVSLASLASLARLRLMVCVRFFVSSFLRFLCGAPNGAHHI